MKNALLLEPYRLGNISLSNKVVMAPMTRTRASSPGDVPTDVNVKYYSQRASAGLIITEAVHISHQGIGYLWVPGIYTSEQIAGWKKIADAVHKKGGKIFMQIFHAGRMSHPYFQIDGSQPVSASAELANGYSAYILNYFNQPIQIPFATPRALETNEIPNIIDQFVTAAQNAIAAGMDGVEIHGANGYLLEQFLNDQVNKRTDQYGGSIENRSRILLEVTEAVTKAIGKEKVGVRLSPFGKLHDIGASDETEALYLHLIKKLNDLDIAYLHLFNQAAFGTGLITDEFVKKVRSLYKNSLILCGGYTPETAAAAIKNKVTDLIAFGRPFIANPDFVERIENGWPLAESDQKLWYGSNGEHGYNDYPIYSK